MTEKILKVTYGQAVHLKNALERAIINGGLDATQKEAYEMVCAWVAELEPVERVIFRKFPHDGAIIALFPDQYNERNGNIGSYMELGQHAETAPDFGDTKPAEAHEYYHLQQELVQQGYHNLKVVKRFGKLGR